jgi:hypothetical protein
MRPRSNKARFRSSVRPRVHSIARALSLASIATAVVSSPALSTLRADEDAANPDFRTLAFGPRLGHRTVYRVRIRAGELSPGADGSTPKIDDTPARDYDITIHRTPTESGAQAVVEWKLHEGVESAWGAPRTLFITTDADGRPASVGRGFAAPEFCDAAEAIFSVLLVPDSPLLGSDSDSDPDATVTWRTKEDWAGFVLPTSMEYEHSIETTDLDRVRLSRKLIAPRRLAYPGGLVEIETLTTELELDATRTRAGKIAHEVRIVARSGSDAGRVTFRQLSAEETSSTALGAETLETLGSEIPALRAIDELAQGTNPAGVVARLFGGGQESSAEKGLEKLVEFEKQHPSPVLAGIARELRTKLALRVESERARAEREARQNAIVGSEAADFTLEDLFGRKISLRDFRGRPVIVAFWGYG